MGRVSGSGVVVDDEAGIRSIATRLLRNLGYETIDAANGEDGLRLFEAHAVRLNLVVLDLTMPRMDGEEAFAAMRRIRHTVPVIIMSSYSERLTLDRFSVNRPDAFLPKPFDRHSLQAALREATPHGVESTGQ